MPIRVSSTRQIEALLADLESPHAVTRDGAVARLSVLGSRAVERVLALATSDRDPAARAAAWRALEGIADPRALDAALQALGAPSPDASAAAAAAGVVRVFIRGARGAVAVDGLTTVVLDATKPETVRIAALAALRDLEPTTLAPLLASLAHDPSAAIRAHAMRADAVLEAPERLRDPAGVLMAAAKDERIADDPNALRDALRRAGDRVTPALLLRIVERVREREGAEPPARRDQWRLARAAAHHALASRGSRLAIYDLRESLETAKGRLPVEFLSSLALVGDATCLDAIAAAHAGTRDAWWRQHLTDAFYAIVAREKLTARSTVLKKIAKRWPSWAGKPGTAG